MSIDYIDYSKVKHIYRVNDDGSDHLEVIKYPVIYINSEYVYFKVGRHQPLDSIRTKCLLPKFDASNPKSGYYVECDVDAEDIEVLKKAHALACAQFNLSNAENLYAHYKNQLEITKEEIDRLKAQIAKLQ